MKAREAYNEWASIYDSNINKTRDLESIAKKEIVSDLHFENCLEIGCGTGKNTVWLLERAKHITAVDISEEMLKKAKEKIKSPQVDFVQADILEEWRFAKRDYDLVTFSLVLEHVEDLGFVISNAANCLKKGGSIYIGELHPFKQYMGSKARFMTEDGEQVVQCFTHHISDFTESASQAGLTIESVKEYFDEDEQGGIPRLLCIVLKK